MNSNEVKVGIRIKLVVRQSVLRGIAQTAEQDGLGIHDWIQRKVTEGIESVPHAKADRIEIDVERVRKAIWRVASKMAVSEGNGKEEVGVKTNEHHFT